MANGEGVEDAIIIEIIAQELRYSFLCIVYCFIQVLTNSTHEATIEHN